ncbi:Gluconate 2-dehydrogenase flavoprotein [Campylobacter jejuni]|nr:Gluconate 2-dehydrogenase flavoprotein [Campylobacter jejuni]
MQDCSKDTVTFRHDLSGLALPYRKMGSFLLGNNAGEGALEWLGF